MPLVVGRYAMYGEIASGGMATVHYGRLHGAVGFSRTVAIKRLHAQYAKDDEFVAMFVDEARLAARVRHPNVVAMLDVISTDGELFLVMEYVAGESLSRLVRAARAEGSPVPLKIVAAVVCGVLHGLHAAHEATNEAGEALDIVHRDVSPQNVLVGVDGAARVLDFGVAKAVGRLATTRDGEVKGKLAYMAPEQLREQLTDRRADLYGTGVVLWELLTGRRLFAAENEGAVVTKILERSFGPPSTHAHEVPPALDAAAMRALARNPSDRFGTARQMALAIEEACGGVASPAQVGEWVEGLAADTLGKRARIVKEIESDGAREAAAAERLPAGETATARPTAATSPTPPAKASRRLVASYAAVAAGAALLLLLLVALRRAPTIAAARASSPPAPLVSGAPYDPAPGTDLADLPEATAAPAAAASAATATAPATAMAATPATAPAAPTPVTPVSPVTRAKSPPRRAPPARASAPSMPAPCAVKSFTDEAGVKHYFNDCPK